MKLKTKRRLGFTIVELVIVIAVIGILSGILIPTISGMIRKSKIAADQTIVASLNTNLAATLVTQQISTEEDVLRVVENTYGVDVKNNFSPQSSSYGYHYWYDYKLGRIILAKADEINNGSVSAYSGKEGNLENDFSSFESSIRGQILPGYYFLDKSSSPLANVVNQVDNISTKENYSNLLNLIHNDLKKDKFDKVFFGTVKNHIDNTVYVSNNGTFRTSEAKNSNNINVIFSNEITNFPTKIYEFDGVNLSENEVSKENKFVGPETLYLPETIEKVDTYSLWYDTTTVSNPKIIINATKTDVSNIFKALSTNATIICEDDSKLLVTENGLVNAENTDEVVSELEYSNPVSSFEISVQEVDGKIKVSNGIIYVSNDQTSFNLSATNFVSTTGKNVSSNKVVWEIPENEYISIDENGIVTINKLIEANNSHLTFTVSATAVAGGVSKSLEIQLVRINYATITLENASPNTLSIDSNNLTPTISINYTGKTSSFAFSGLSIGQNHTGMVTCDSTLSITTEENEIFTIENNALTLKQYSGTANFTIKIGDYIQTTFTVVVIDNSASPYTLVFENTDKYLYRLGNFNYVTLGQLFDTTKAPKSPVIKIYDASLTDGNGNRTEISTNGNFSANILNESYLTQDSWADVQIKFSGSGVAIIEMHSNETRTTLPVEIVDGKNCSKISDFTSNSNLNKIILNNIDFTDYKYATYLSNISIYGNGFEFNVPNFKANTVAFIDITNGLIDNLVLKGTVYPEVVYSGDVATGYYNSGIVTRGNSIISNSYIEGFRQPVKTQGSHLLLSNTTLYGGVYANLEVNSGNITLENVTTVQAPMQTTVGDSTNVLGAGIVFSEGATISSEFNINGYLHQYNWVSEKDKSYIQDTTVKNAFSSLFTDNQMAEFVHTVDGVQYGNTGIIFNGIRDISTISDNRTDKSSIPYVRIEKNVLGVTGTIYSVSNINGNISKENMTYSGYTPNTQSTLKPKFTFSNIGIIPEEGEENYYYYDGSIHIGIPIPEGSFTLNTLEGVSISKYGKNYNAITWACNGGTINENSITFTQKGSYTLSYTITDRNFFDKYGNSINKSVEYTYTIDIEVAYTTIPDAVITVSTDNNVIYDRTGSSDEYKIGSYWIDLSDYSLCAEVLTGLVIKDYDENGNLISTDYTGQTSMPANLSISATGSCSQSGFGFGVYKDKYYIYSNTFANHRDNYLITVTYSYTGQNGKTVEATKTFTFTESTPSAKITTW